MNPQLILQETRPQISWLMPWPSQLCSLHCRFIAWGTIKPQLYLYEWMHTNRLISVCSLTGFTHQFCVLCQTENLARGDIPPISIAVVIGRAVFFFTHVTPPALEERWTNTVSSCLSWERKVKHSDGGMLASRDGVFAPRHCFVWRFHF